MDIKKRFELIKRNTEEIITEEELLELVEKKKNLIVYCGYEPSGPMHLGHFVTILKLIDLQKAGFKVKVLLADIHALLNKKGNENEIKLEVENWRKTLKAIGLKCEIILGSDFQFGRNYQEDVMKLAQNSTIQRGLRSMQEIARDIDNATISQLLYPLMQVADIKYLKIDVALGGMEQRKVHMIGRDMSKVIGYDFIALHTPLITSLKGPGEKMSKSIQGSGISVTDSYLEIEKSVNAAYCPAKIVEDNPILQITKLIIFPKFDKIEIKREKKFGRNLKFSSYGKLEMAFAEGKLHPADLKKAVIEYLERIIAPIRKDYK